jgi:autophagy-related protein 2
VITVSNFSVSSNIAAQTNTSTLRFMAEDAALFISNKTGSRHVSPPVDLQRDYVCVLDLGLFELSLRLYDRAGEQNHSSPRVDLRASINILHIRTCADSGKALTDLLTYFAADGDLMSADESENHESTTYSGSAKVDQVLVNMNAVDNNQNNAHNLSRSQVEHVHDMMEEAMKDTNGIHSNGKSSKYYYFYCFFMCCDKPFCQAVSWFRQSHRFHPRPVRVGFVVDRVVWVQS